VAQKKWMLSGVTFCLLVFLVISGCSRQNQQANAIQIKGSDTMVNLGQAWAEAFMQANPKVSVAVTGGGSGTGIAALLSKTCDIAELSRELKPEELAMAKQKGFQPKQTGRGGPSRQPTVAIDHGPAGRDLFRFRQQLERSRRR
jgi:ABC-type phosphate transport system substrate-binding protein